VAATWNSTTVSDGSHQLHVRTADAAGNCGPSAPVTVTVDDWEFDPEAAKSLTDAGSASATKRALPDSVGRFLA
jgi:hypothetical protein